MGVKFALRVLIVAIGVVATVAVAAYVWWYGYYRPVDFEAVVDQRAKLIDGLESYQQVDSFLAELDKRSLAYQVQLPSSSANESARRPPFNIATVRVERFYHLGYSGELVADFFNNRLVGVRFYPSDTDGYRRQLLSHAGIDLVAGSEARVSENSRVWFATDSAGRAYFGWEDTRLAEEMELWIRRYSCLLCEVHTDA